MSPAEGPRASRLSVSGPTAAPWLNILKACLLWTGIPAAAAAAAAFLAAGAPGAASVASGWLLIALFFGISLLVGHVVGRKNPSGAIGMFAVTYAVKVVGFAVILWLVGKPAWLEGPWFFYTAIGTVVLWQTAEVIAFSRTRHLIYSDAPASPDNSAKGISGAG
ncbi:hypothetical protein H9639_09230 [Arthrobacter sp. Sa2CUA1]|uniref:ATP synthase protein I n=1 Tax=Arthrobacter gallicola TaxID=2762225 RepID=A0ABR8UTQ1_9MICC|nr:hypothetical protein [Arthrobacter gallicola]MBD7995476.1 hypothetical protein [Arthrobacter gallicola]